MSIYEEVIRKDLERRKEAATLKERYERKRIDSENRRSLKMQEFIKVLPMLQKLLNNSSAYESIIRVDIEDTKSSSILRVKTFEDTVTLSYKEMDNDINSFSAFVTKEKIGEQKDYNYAWNEESQYWYENEEGIPELNVLQDKTKEINVEKVSAKHFAKLLELI